MNAGLSKQTVMMPTPVLPVGRTNLLQRKCDCGQHTIAGRKCEACSEGRSQHSATSRAEIAEVPPIVQEVLRSTGQPLDKTTRALMEPHFEHDFSRVRLHKDERAAESALSVNALAYTVGQDVVFGAGQFQPGTKAGLHLLAHELSHVVQQNDRAGASSLEKLEIGAPGTAAEREADHAAGRVVSGLPATLERSSGLSLMRTLRVERPAELIPNPQGNGLVQTNAATVEQYLQSLAPAGQPRVDATSGVVTMSEDFCRSRGFFGRLGRGMASGFLTGARIGAYALGVGAIPGAIIGGLVGGIAGIFGADSQAEESSTPTGSTCVCDFINSSNTWRVVIDDMGTPLTGNDFVRIQSPNSLRIYGAATVSGRLENEEPWLAFGHELCGHAWLQERNRDEGVNPERDLRHHRSVERENLLRREHGLEARGYRLKDPYCGESFSRPRDAPAGDPQWQPMYDERNRQAFRGTALESQMDDTHLDDCQRMREQYLGELARRYTVSQRIP